MEMEMRARKTLSPCETLTPAFSLYTSSLRTHCSACFSPLPNPSSLPLYCSDHCRVADAPLRLSSAENNLRGGDGDDSDLRASLRLISYFEVRGAPVEAGRVGGLMSNRESLMSAAVGMYEQGDDAEVLARIRDGARAMAKARRVRDGLDVETVGECEVEETILCVVLTNAVEVQVNGGPGIGIAVYDVAFSWINHSCSPNACYQFLLQQSSSGEPQMLIVPAGHDGFQETKYSDCNGFEPKREGEKYGPRIVVRSIRAINEGDEVTVAYTDLLQPKAVRQLELWSKYRFICSCQRCSACPPTYVDRTLQEIFAVDYGSGLLSSDYKDEASERFEVHVDDAINDYLMYAKPRSCSEKLERLLINGILDEQWESKEAKSKHQFFLHPLHYLSLNAYMTLSSAYKTRASELLGLNSQVEVIQFEAFHMYRTSAAYSFLLAGATHHLFLSESSLVVSVANFWTEAGRSLLNVARSAAGESLPNLSPAKETFRLFHKYRKWASGLRPAPKETFEEISREFLEFVTDVITNIWPFLVHEACYFKMIKDPIDFGWIKTINSTSLLGSKEILYGAATESCGSRRRGLVCSKQERDNLFQLGVHCLLYGGYLSRTFCGHSPLSDLCIENPLAEMLI